jgi:hypothetical protein
MLDLAQNTPGELGAENHEVFHERLDAEHIHRIADVYCDGETVLRGEGRRASAVLTLILDIIVH